jgi:hypothetical protein
MFGVFSMMSKRPYSRHGRYQHDTVFVDLQCPNREDDGGEALEEQPDANGEAQEKDASAEQDLYCFTISLQKHITDVLSKLDPSTERIRLRFARETNEKNGAYDLTHLRRFPRLTRLEITPEDSVSWNEPVQIRIPSDVISRVRTLYSDRIVLNVEQNSEFVTLSDPR